MPCCSLLFAVVWVLIIVFFTFSSFLKKKDFVECNLFLRIKYDLHSLCCCWFTCLEWKYKCLCARWFYYREFSCLCFTDPATNCFILYFFFNFSSSFTFFTFCIRCTQYHHWIFHWIYGVFRSRLCLFDSHLFANRMRIILQLKTKPITP